jgi:outer membrane protein insertion porin family
MMISDPRLQRVLRVPAGESGVFSTRLLVSLDERDSPFTPTRGFFGSTSAEYVTTLAAQQQPGEAPFFSNFLKLGLTLNGYVPIGDFVIAGQFRTGGILHLQDGSQTYPNRQYFLGGVDTMRGFNQDQLLPQDLADLTLQQIEIARMNGQPSPLSANSVTRGGDLFMLFRAEVRIPIVESLQAGVFADIGNHWADPATFDFLTLRPTAGLGIRIATPVGPLALDYGFNILRRADLNEPVGAFHFSIGVF